MTVDVVTLEQATRLAALGYPQDGWPQMVWIVPDSDAAILQYQYDLSIGKAMGSVEEIAAPTLLAALDWLEREHGWRWMRAYREYADTRSGQRSDGMVWFAAPPPDYRHAEMGWAAHASTASGLLDAVLDAIDKQQEVQHD